MEIIWKWAAYGKHPAAKDFFKLGQFGPLVQDFSRWVEKGYQLFAARKKFSQNSWRFWTRGLGKDGLGCGVVRDSGDQLARPYPLLIMGVGALNGWEDQWDLNPLACERSWAQMEYLFTRTFGNLKQMEEEVQKIPPPLSQWSELRQARRNSGGDQSINPIVSSPGFQEMQRQLSRLAQKGEVFFPLDPELFPDPAGGIHDFHSFLKKEEKNIPQSVFMGGTLERTHLAVFRRPLIPADFEKLWMGSPQGEAKE
jgi:type VI secretion system protein VasJ